MMAIVGYLAMAGKPWHSPTHKRGFTLPPPLVVECRLDSLFTDRQDYVTFKVTYVDEGIGEGQWTECNNLCLGRVHMDHQGCDETCDIHCSRGTHAIAFYPDIDYDRSDEFESLMRQAAKRDQSPIEASTITDLIWSDAQKPFDNSDYVQNYEWPCWNKKPCSEAYKGYNTHYVGVHVEYQFSHTEPRMGTLNFRVYGPKGDFEIADYEVPDFDSPFDENEQDCRCAPYPAINRTGLLKNIFEKYPTGLTYDGEFAGIKPSYQEWSKYDLKIQCPDMNSVQITARNPTAMPVNLNLWPGTMLVPNDPMTQRMLVTNRVGLSIMPWGSLDVRIPLAGTPELQQDSQQKGPVTSMPASAVCINMNLHEPSPKDSFTPVAAPSGEMRKLGTKAARERFIGPWTQTRFWIASDAALFDDIKKRLIPRPTEGHYLRALYEVGTQGHYDFSKGDLKKCMEPRFIVGGSASKKATQWFVHQFERIDPKALAGWIKDNGKEFLPLCAGDAEDYEKRHVADVANALCQSKKAELRDAGLQFVRSVVPESFRSQFAEIGGLKGIVTCLRSEDEALVAKALDIAEMYKDAKVMPGLANLSPKLSEGLRNRALALAKVISKP